MSSSIDLDDKKPIEGRTSTSTEEQAISRTPSSRHAPHKDLEKQEPEIHDDAEPHLKTLSTVTSQSAIPPPPDGGLHAWLKVLGGFLIYINIWYV
jgi:hypothetical protein